MKIILFLFLALFSKINIKIITVTGGMFWFNKLEAQTIWSTSQNSVDSTYTWFRTLSPTNTYGNRFDIMRFNKDSFNMRHKRIMLDSMLNRNDPVYQYRNTGLFMWLNAPRREWKFTRFDSLPLSSAQVTSALGFVPMSSSGGVSSFNTRTGAVTLTGTDVNNALGYTPLSTQVNADWNSSSGASEILNKPTIPAAQVNSDWGSSSGVSQILNKPNVVLMSDTLPNRIMTKSAAMTATASLQSSINGKEPAISVGTSAQYLDGTKTWQTLNTTAVPEGSNLYYTSARFNTAFSGKTTTDLAEGTNLYYTAARFNTAFSGKSTTDLAEGTNLYFTNARSRNAISLTTTGSGAATYNSTSGVLNIPTPSAPTRTFNSSPGRALSTTGTNNTFVISASNDVRVVYTINFSIALLAALSNGVVSLDYSTDGGANWVPISSVSQAYSVAITLTMNGDQTLVGTIPAGARVRIYRSTATNCTITLTKQQEVTEP